MSLKRHAMSQKLKSIVILFIGFNLLLSCNFGSDSVLERYIRRANNLSTKFADTFYGIGKKGPLSAERYRDKLPAAVNDLQKIKRDWERLKPPESAKAYDESMRIVIQVGIDYLSAILEDKSQDVLDEYWKNLKESSAKANQEWLKLMEVYQDMF